VISSAEEVMGWAEVFPGGIRSREMASDGGGAMFSELPSLFGDIHLSILLLVKVALSYLRPCLGKTSRAK
jgi:hypothetical protein